MFSRTSGSLPALGAALDVTLEDSVGVGGRSGGGIARRGVGIQGPLQVGAAGVVEAGIGEVEGTEPLAELGDVGIEYAAQRRDPLGLSSPAAPT